MQIFTKYLLFRNNSSHRFRVYSMMISNGAKLHHYMDAMILYFFRILVIRFCRYSVYNCTCVALVRLVVLCLMLCNVSWSFQWHSTPQHESIHMDNVFEHVADNIYRPILQWQCTKNLSARNICVIVRYSRNQTDPGPNNNDMFNNRAKNMCATPRTANINTGPLITPGRRAHRSPAFRWVRLCGVSSKLRTFGFSFGITIHTGGTHPSTTSCKCTSIRRKSWPNCG